MGEGPLSVEEMKPVTLWYTPGGPEAVTVALNVQLAPAASEPAASGR